MSERRVSIHIDRLVLKGVSPEERGPLVNSLREQLGRMLSSGFDASAARSESLPAIRLNLPANGSGPGAGRALGRHIANAIGKRARR